MRTGTQKRITKAGILEFRKRIHDHYLKHGRRLPWRRTRDPYHILVSEIMLQQTQADRVASKYQEFITAFPTFDSLAQARLSTVLKVWQGLGYNRRALVLKRIGERVMSDFNGTLPEDAETLRTFPGIGPTTATSIAAFAFNKPVVFIETNIRAVFIHCFFPRKNRVSDKEILPLVERTLDRSNPRRWYNALMDYGMMLKKRHHNPGRKSAHYQKQGPFKGSNRQLRGAIIKILTQERSVSIARLAKRLDVGEEKIRANVTQLQSEGFIRRERTQVFLV